MDVRRLDDARRFAADKLVKQNVFATPRLFLDLYCLEPGQAQRVHAHEGQDKVYLAREGRAVVTIGQEERELATGEAVLAPSGVPHGVRNASSERAVLLVVVAPPPPHG